MTLLDLIEQKLDELLRILGTIYPPHLTPPTPITSEQQAMEMAKRGHISESIAFLKAQSIVRIKR